MKRLILVEDIEECMYELSRCDGIGSSLLLNNQELIDFLKEIDLLSMTTRHSHCGTAKLRDFYKNEDAGIINFLKKEGDKIGVEVLDSYPFFEDINNLTSSAIRNKKSL